MLILNLIMIICLGIASETTSKESSSNVREGSGVTHGV